MPLLPHYAVRPDTVPHHKVVLHGVQHQKDQPTDFHHGHLAAPHTALSHIMPHVHHICMKNQPPNQQAQINILPTQEIQLLRQAMMKPLKTLNGLLKIKISENQIHYYSLM
jgi:hypothetical protein